MKTKAKKIKARRMRLTITVESQRVCDIMCNAIEGNHMVRAWCESVKPIGNTAKLSGNWYYDHPEIYDLGVLFDVRHVDAEKDDVMKTTRCHQGHIAAALKIMAEKHGRHFGAFVAEDDDAITADVFLQLVVYGKVIFG